MNKDIKISIVVPVYKVEKYLERCVNSILSQSYENIECILVDDGSPDSCPMICDSIASRDDRVKVIHQKNSGVSAARNVGISVAEGEWISFVDSDDWINEDMYIQLLSSAEKTGSDVIIFGINHVTENNLIKQKYTEYKENLQPADFEMNEVFFAIWNKFIRTSLIKENNIIFDTEAKLAEDACFFYRIAMYAKKISSIQECLYNYYNNASGATALLNSTVIITGINGIQKLEADIRKENNIELLRNLNALKLAVKFHFIIGKNRDYDLWRKYFPETKFYALFHTSLKKRIIYLLIYLHLDKLVFFLCK